MESGGGAEVTLQTSIAEQVVPLIRQQCFIRQIAERAKVLIDMTKPKIKIPRLTRAQGAYSVKAGKPAPEFKARLDGIDLIPEKIMTWMPVDQEVFEDSTIRDIEGMLKQEMANEFAQAEELAFLLGDVDMDHGDGDPRNVFDGLLKSASAGLYAYDDTLDSANGLAITSNLIRAARFLGIYGRNKRDVVYMVGLTAEEALLRNSAFQTMSAYAYGQGAGIFSGEIGRLNGSPVIATSFLDAQEGEQYSKALVLNQSSFCVGDWKQFSIRVFDEILAQTDQIAIRARERIAFTIRYPEAIMSIQNMPITP